MFPVDSSAKYVSKLKKAPSLWQQQQKKREFLKLQFFLTKSFFAWKSFISIFFRQNFKIFKKPPLQISAAAADFQPHLGVEGGGMFFWFKLINFCQFVIKLILGGLWGWADLPATHRPISGPYRPNFEFWNFKNLAFFGHFGYFSKLFFSNFHFCSKSSKIVLGGFFSS